MYLKNNYLCTWMLCLFNLAARRLWGSVVRAGMSSNHLQNPEVGQPVAYDEARSGAVIDFLPDPYVTARYVSVDIPRNNAILHVAEVMIEEVTMDTTETGIPSSDKGKKICELLDFYRMVCIE